MYAFNSSFKRNSGLNFHFQLGVTVKSKKICHCSSTHTRIQSSFDPFVRTFLSIEIDEILSFVSVCMSLSLSLPLPIYLSCGCGCFYEFVRISKNCGLFRRIFSLPFGVDTNKFGQSELYCWLNEERLCHSICAWAWVRVWVPFCALMHLKHSYV